MFPEEFLNKFNVVSLVPYHSLYYCLVPSIRGPYTQRGLFNGYVWIPHLHPYRIMRMRDDNTAEAMDGDLGVHGGITFRRGYGVRGLVLGWDTGHIGDTATIWTHDLCLEETEAMAMAIENWVAFIRDTLRYFDESRLQPVQAPFDVGRTLEG